jgi:hypothetical protein
MLIINIAMMSTYERKVDVNDVGIIGKVMR